MEKSLKQIDWIVVEIESCKKECFADFESEVKGHWFSSAHRPRDLGRKIDAKSLRWSIFGFFVWNSPFEHRPVSPRSEDHWWPFGKPVADFFSGPWCPRAIFPRRQRLSHQN